MAIMEVLAFVTPGAFFGPGLQNKVMGFIEHFPVIGWVGVIKKLLAAGTPHPTGDQPTFGNTIDSRQLFSHS